MSVSNVISADKCRGMTAQARAMRRFIVIHGCRKSAAMLPDICGLRRIKIVVERNRRRHARRKHAATESRVVFQGSGSVESMRRGRIDSDDDQIMISGATAQVVVP